MFVSGPWPVRVGRAGQEADGGEVGGGGGGVGLRGEAARRSGAASEVAVWACGVAAAARAAATAPGLRLFVLGALGGVAGVWEARESGVWRRFSAEQGERMRTSGLLVWFALSMVAFPRKRTWLNCVRDARTPDQGGQTRNEHPYVYGFRQLGFVNRVYCARFVAG